MIMTRSFVYHPDDNSGVEYRWDGPLTRTVEIWAVGPGTVVQDVGQSFPHPAGSFELDLPEHCLADPDVWNAVTRYHDTPPPRKSLTIIVSPINDEIEKAVLDAANRIIADVVHGKFMYWDVDVIAGTPAEPLSGDNIHGRGVKGPDSND